ncbi:hypothetical protein CLOP_g7037 [Closterium sp. NIES-67]|nr:hypothetical protein CLOP_g7037 [Closterium sp. NIES-67]
MARNAETVVYVVDAGPSVPRSVFQECWLWVEQQMVQKLLFNPRDDVAVVAFGCEETSNDLHIESEGGYEHTSVVVPHRLVDPSSLKAVHAMEQAAEAGIQSDWLSALVVSLDLLIKSRGQLALKKGVKRIVLLTGGGTPLEEASEGTNEEQVTTLADTMRLYGITLHAVLLRGEVGGKEARAAGGGRGKGVFNENEKLLRSFFDAGASRDPRGRKSAADEWGGKMEGFAGVGRGGAEGESAQGAGEEGRKEGGGGSVCEGELRVIASLAAAGMLFRVKPRVLPTTSYRGDLLVAPGFTIKVWAYKKTFAQRLPPLKLLSRLAPPSDPSATGDVKMEREYKVVQSRGDGHGEGGGGGGDEGGEGGGECSEGAGGGGGEEPETVGLDELVRAYKYGPQVIPVSDYDRMANRFLAEKGIQLIGFTMREQIPRSPGASM